MNVHIITIGYKLPDDLQALYQAATSAKHHITWHVFIHSGDPAVMDVCMGIKRGAVPAVVYPYFENRGLAKSWNEGVLNAYDNGAEVAIIANDDVLPEAGDVDLLVEAASDQRDCYIVVTRGFDVREQRWQSMEFGFFAINRLALQTIGMFDENFFPIYWEDVDYGRRALLAGLKEGYCGQTQMVHQRSKSLTTPGQQDIHLLTYEQNHSYYLKKWGGTRNHEVYEQPFDDERFGLKIAPESRHAPYPGHNREIAP